MLSQQIANALRPGTNFAGVSYTTSVKTAAAHKAKDVRKNVTANVQLFSNIKDARRVFEAAVKRSADRIGTNDANAVSNFTAQENWYEHTACYSIVKHRKTGAEYLYAIYNSATVDYTINGAPATVQQVAELLTPSAAKALLQPTKVVENQTHGISHTVQVRVISLDNIKSVTVNGQTLI